MERYDDVKGCVTLRHRTSLAYDEKTDAAICDDAVMAVDSFNVINVSNNNTSRGSHNHDTVWGIIENDADGYFTGNAVSNYETFPTEHPEGMDLEVIRNLSQVGRHEIIVNPSATRRETGVNGGDMAYTFIEELGTRVHGTRTAARQDVQKGQAEVGAVASAHSLARELDSSHADGTGAGSVVTPSLGVGVVLTDSHRRAEGRSAEHGAIGCALAGRGHIQFPQTIGAYASVCAHTHTSQVCIYGCMFVSNRFN